VALAHPDVFRPEWDVAAYPAAEAGRLVGLSPTRVRRWLRGYDYRYAAGIQHQQPVIRQRGTYGTTYASFLDLIDLLFVKRFLDYGISLQKVRKALNEATELLGTDHFARRSFFTDGSNIYLEVRERGDAILQLLSGGQWVIAPIIQELAVQIDFDSPSGLARRWYPLGPDGFVVLDPLVSFGRPTIANRGIATANIYDFFLAERRRVEPVCSWLQLEQQEVRAAVAFEERLAA
jgi:uncharacterized protein (DUF433 family)